MERTERSFEKNGCPTLVIVHTFPSPYRLLQLCYCPYFPYPFQTLTAVLSAILSRPLPGYHSCVVVHTFPSPSRLSQLCYRPCFPFPFQAITAVLSSILYLPLPLKACYTVIILLSSIHSSSRPELSMLSHCYRPYITPGQINGCCCPVNVLLMSCCSP